MPASTEFVTLAADDGTSMRSYVAHPEEAPRAGLIVFQEIFGVNSHIRDIAERFAREGYLAIAPELFHRSAPGFESGYADMAEGLGHMKQLTDDGVAADIRAAFDWIQSVSPGKKLSTAAIGYCMGGRIATLASMTVPIACGISYYGGGIAPSPYHSGLLGRLKEVQAPMLFFWGGLDGFITPEHVKMVIDQMRAANKTFVSVEFSNADHGFFCNERASYNANAATEAWPLTLAYLNNHAG